MQIKTHEQKFFSAPTNWHAFLENGLKTVWFHAQTIVWLGLGIIEGTFYNK